MSFEDWLSEQGCIIERIQEDDGSGYYCLFVTLPTGVGYEITVMTG